MAKKLIDLIGISKSYGDAVETDDAAGKYSVYGGRKSDIDRNLFCAALTAAEKTI